MRNLSVMFAVLGLLVATMLKSPMRAHAQDAQIIEILEHWKARQQAVESGRFVWREQRIEAKGWRKDPRMSKEVNPKGITDPPEDRITDNESVLTLDGAKYKYTVRSLSLEQRAPEELPPYDYVAVFDGQIQRTYYAPWMNKEYPQGDEGICESPPTHRISYLKPVLWAFRALDPTVTDFLPNKMRSIRREDVPGGKTLLIIDQHTDSATVVSIWVDPARSFVIERFLYMQTRPIVQFDIVYQKDAGSTLWIPESWKYATLKTNGAPRLTANAKMVQYSVNDPLSADEFEFAFPVGTWVTDSNGHMYIQRAHGKKRPITDGELGRSYQYYLATETPDIAARQVARWWYYSIGALMLIAAVCIFLRHRRRTTQ